MSVDTRELLSRLRVIGSIALMPRVTSTNSLGRRIVDECIENEIPLPSAIIIAREQTAGRGRGSRSWHSPADKGIYATALYTRIASELAHLPLQIAVIVAQFLRDTYGLDARIKWPNDILVGRKKIAGILIETRTRNAEAFILIGTGINVAAVPAELSSSATSISESLNREVSLDEATEAFVTALDHGLAEIPTMDAVARWKELSALRPGEVVTLRVGSHEVRGEWQGIDDLGRALIREGERLHQISAADLILME